MQHSNRLRRSYVFCRQTLCHQSKWAEFDAERAWSFRYYLAPGFGCGDTLISRTGQDTAFNLFSAQNNFITLVRSVSLIAIMVWGGDEGDCEEI